MKIVKKLNVPADYFYKQVMDSVLFDIRKATGKTPTMTQLNNKYSYVKEFSKTSRARITINKALTNQAYYFETSTTKNKFEVKYDIKAIDDKSCEVTYQETMESFGFMQQMNDMVLSVIVGVFKKRRFKKMLEAMESAY